MKEETQYEQQLTTLMAEAEQEAKMVLPQPKQRLLIPTFSRSKSSLPAIAEKAQAV